MFGIRGALSVAEAAGSITPDYPFSISPTTWDALIYIGSEWIPCMLIIVTFWHRRPPQGSANLDIVAPLMGRTYLDENQPQPGVVESYQYPEYVSGKPIGVKYSNNIIDVGPTQFRQ